GCCPCQPGFYMAWYNKCSQCLPFRDCLGNEILFEGNYRNDRVCGDLRSTTVATPTETTVLLSSSPSPDLAIDQTTDSSIYSIIDEGNPWLNFDIVTALSLVTMISISCVIGCMVWMTYKWKCKTQGPCTCQCEACQGCMGASSTHESAHSLDSITSENPDPPTTDTKELVHYKSFLVYHASKLVSHLDYNLYLINIMFTLRLSLDRISLFGLDCKIPREHNSTGDCVVLQLS
ncbi:hypothetical protein BSL78_20870, partial [Apostichopus japonicus]